jgi:hypothetical protein
MKARQFVPGSRLLRSSRNQPVGRLALHLMSSKLIGAIGEHPGDLHLDGRIEKSIGEPGR